MVVVVVVKTRKSLHKEGTPGKIKRQVAVSVRGDLLSEVREAISHVDGQVLQSMDRFCTNLPSELSIHPSFGHHTILERPSLEMVLPRAPEV